MRSHSLRRTAFMRGVLGTLALVAAVIGALSGTARAQSEGGRPTPMPSGTGNEIARGRAVFDHVCGRCHPNGEEDVGPRIVNKNWDEARMLHQIRSGGGHMRAISTTRLPDAQVPALMAYLRTLHAVR